MREIKALHVEDYKRRRSAGEISEQKTAADEAREQQLRSELARNPKRRTMKANAQYGWLGRHAVHSCVSARTINYELRCLFTFFRWAIKQNLLFVNPVANIEKFRVPKRSLPRFMTSEELREFFAACREDERRVFSEVCLIWGASLLIVSSKTISATAKGGPLYQLGSGASSLMAAITRVPTSVHRHRPSAV